MAKRTGIERRILAALRARGVKVREQANELPGRPDFVLERRRMIIRAQGCHWHGCQVCPPKAIDSNPLQWAAMQARARERDAYVRRQLEFLGWRVEDVWEHSTDVGADIDRILMAVVENVKNVS